MNTTKKITLNDDDNRSITINNGIMGSEITIEAAYKYPTHTHRIINECFILEYTGTDRNETDKRCQKDFNRLLRLGFTRKFEVHMDEQERGWAEGISKDCQDPKQHGRLMFASLDDCGTGGAFYWDYYKQTCVRKEDLTVIQ